MANRSGAASHKEGCECAFCKSRKRKEEADAQSARAGGFALAPVQQSKEVGPVIPTMEEAATRERVAKWMSIRAVEPDLSMTDIAKQLGISRQRLNQSIQTATKKGWLTFEDPIDRIEHQIVPQVIDNIEHFLKNKDRTVTVEAMKGFIVPDYKKAKGFDQDDTRVAQTMIAIKIEMPDPSEPVRIMTGQIVGAPREIRDGEVE